MCLEPGQSAQQTNGPNHCLSKMLENYEMKHTLNCQKKMKNHCPAFWWWGQELVPGCKKTLQGKLCEFEDKFYWKLTAFNLSFTPIDVMVMKSYHMVSSLQYFYVPNIYMYQIIDFHFEWEELLALCNTRCVEITWCAKTKSNNKDTAQWV